MTPTLQAMSLATTLPTRPGTEVKVCALVRVGALSAEVWLTAEEAARFGADVVSAARRAARRVHDATGGVILPEPDAASVAWTEDDTLSDCDRKVIRAARDWRAAARACETGGAEMETLEQAEDDLAVAVDAHMAERSRP